MQDEVEVKARELLAAEYERIGMIGSALALRRGDYGVDYLIGAALDAIAAALRQRPVVDDARMARALEWVRAERGFYDNPEAAEHLHAIEEAIDAYSGRKVRVPNLGDSEAQFIADGKNLDCPACGGSGHAGDVAAPIGTVGAVQEEHGEHCVEVWTEAPLSFVAGQCLALVAAYQQDNGGQQG